MRFIAAITVLCGLLANAAEFEIKNEAEFAKLVDKDAKVEKLATDMKFVEGPVWSNKDGGFLIFSDIPSNELKKWNAKDGLTTFRSPSNNANGNLYDGEGLLLSCEHGTRRVTRTEKDGTITVLVDKHDGKKLNSPNDIAVKSDGTIYFTDPPYGIRPPDVQEQPKNFVFRFDPKTKEIKPVVDDFKRPNGLCFSPDEKKLYIADSDGSARHIRVFDVAADGSLTNGKTFYTLDKGAPDGIRCDTAGNVWSSAGDGVHVYAPDGALIGKVLVPESPANLCFGDADNKTVYITARKSLYRIKTKATGAQKNP